MYPICHRPHLRAYVHQATRSQPTNVRSVWFYVSVREEHLADLLAPTHLSLAHQGCIEQIDPLMQVHRCQF